MSDYAKTGEMRMSKEVRDFLLGVISDLATPKNIKDSAQVVLDHFMDSVRKRALQDAQKDDF